MNESRKCAWCDKEITGEIFGITGNVDKKTLDTAEFKLNRGSEIEMEFPSISKMVRVIITGKDSQAEKEGWDVIWATCSDECREGLEGAIANERLFLRIARSN